MKYKLSIITINLNNSKGLEKTIGSVTSQSFSNIEHIIIDGGSTDNSVDIIKKYEAHINYWESKTDTGIYNAMNKGIRISKGEYCLFLNSGDCLTSKNVLESVFKNITADIIVGNLNCCDAFTNQVLYTKSSPAKLTARELILESLPHPATFIRRHLFETVSLYNEKLKISSDWEFYLKAFLNHGASYQHLDLIVADFYNDGISSSIPNQELIQIEHDKILNQYLPLFVDDYKALNDYELYFKKYFKSDEYKIISFLKATGLVSACHFIFRVYNKIIKTFQKYVKK